MIMPVVSVFMYLQNFVVLVKNLILYCFVLFLFFCCFLFLYWPLQPLLLPYGSMR